MRGSKCWNAKSCLVRNQIEHNNVAICAGRNEQYLEGIELVATKVSTNPRSIFYLNLRCWEISHPPFRLSLTLHGMFQCDTKQERRTFLIILHGKFGTSDKKHK